MGDVSKSRHYYKITKSQKYEVEKNEVYICSGPYEYLDHTRAQNSGNAKKL